MKLKLKEHRFDTNEEIQAKSQTVLDTLDIKRTSRKCSTNGGDSRTGVYMWEGTNSRVMAADRPYGELYDFYSVSPEYFGYTFVCLVICEYGNLEACLCLPTAHVPLNPLQNLSNEQSIYV
jgi:hypothetical protein